MAMETGTDLEIRRNDNDIAFAMTSQLARTIYELTKEKYPMKNKKNIHELQPGDQVLRHITAGNVLNLESHVVEITETEIIVADNTFTDCIYRYDLKGRSIYGDPKDRLVIP